MAMAPFCGVEVVVETLRRFRPALRRLSGASGADLSVFHRPTVPSWDADRILCEFS